MASFGSLQFNNNSFNLEEANIYGIFEPHGYMTWHIEMFPTGEDNYIMLNALVFDNIFSPKQLTGIKYRGVSEENDLYENTVVINGDDRFLQSIEMEFGHWDAENQSVQLRGNGFINPENNLPDVTYLFNAVLKFNYLNIFETTEEATRSFVETHLQEYGGSLEVKFEQVPSGLMAIIAGRF
jgi:hypothetical protein